MQVDVTLTDVDQIDERQLAAIVGMQSEPQQPQLRRLQSLAAASKQLIALVDGPERVHTHAMAPRSGHFQPLMSVSCG